MARPPARRSSNRPAKVMTVPSRTLEVTIESLGARGDGVAHDGKDLFYVPFSLTGDTLRVKTVGRQGDGLSCTIEAILTPSPQRIEALCSHFGKCGGCSLQHVSQSAYDAWKVGLLSEPLRRVGIDLEPRGLVSVPLGSRRRAQWAFINRQGVCVIGFHERGNHRVVDVQHCAILLPDMVALLEPLRHLLSGLIPSGSGEVTVTQTETGLDVLIEGELTLDLFTREKLASFADTQDLARLSWVQPGGEVEPVARRLAPLVRFGTIGVEPPSGSFIQPTVMGEKAISQVILEAIGPGGKVADLYAGCGSFSIPLALQGTAVHAVEGNALALAGLTQAAHREGLSITTETRDLARRPLLPHELKHYKAVVFDPPRAGALDQCQQLAEGGPGIVVAVSCNPSTLARDLNVLIEGGYTIQSITPIDQFPFTSHLETVVVLKR